MNDKKYSIEMNEVRQVPRASMDEDKRRAYVEVCSALAYGKTLPDSLSALKDRTAAMIRERANAAMNGDYGARVAINSISVSYTHLDVYKRQIYGLAFGYEA